MMAFDDINQGVCLEGVVPEYVVEVVAPSWAAVSVSLDPGALLPLAEPPC